MTVLRPHEVREGSGLEGVVRGIGGAFGVALTGVIMEKRQSWHFGHLVEDHRFASLDSIRLLEGIRGILWGNGSVGPQMQVQAMSLLRAEFAQAALIGAFQDTLVLLALLQVLAIIPTLLIYSRKAPTPPRGTKSEDT
jgi:DHA2 family multidrug resistance protein